MIENKELKSFKDAKNVKERYKVWKDTYKQEFTEKGIFEENIQAYQIGKDKYTLDIDTKPIDATDKKGKYHQFRTILRKYNVSRRENAFEVLVNLFLCKIVDETENPNDLKFYWKGIAYDSYFDLVDRLQELYKIGMDKFLKQDIVYISNKDIDKAFWTMKQKRNATKDTIKDIFRQLKFFKGLDFEFVKVHNQQGFDKNAKILLEIIQMWQGLRLLTAEQNQFLGDMFEFFLDNGIKQSEGQFFTPVPICKFVVSSLPLEDKISNSSEPIKAIDYACGAGHFLNEYALNITPIVKKHKNENAVNEYYKNIYGIEKEDRLAKVAKVSAFMYGQDEINIIDADALDNHKEIKEQSFDCLVANPPFAVEDFLLTLDEEIREQYELIETINDLGNKNIQCFFLERAKQLLAPNGVAGIIVPSSILNNSDNTHIKTREILLKYFDFVSIIELGSQTFGKTGTNTVILFIKRKGLKPEVATHFKNRIDDFFEDWENEKSSNGGAYQDTNIISSYCNHLDIDINLYEKILQNILDVKLFDIEIFAEYKKAFENSTEIKNLKDKKQFKDKSLKEQKEELEEKLLKYIQKIEKEKLYFYMLSFNNPTKVLVVKSPSDNKEQKNFLGYEWSGAKGSEGIKYFGGENINDIQTPLFDPKNRDNEEKISYLIKEHFSGNTKTIKEEYKENCSYINLVDMLDFSRVEFTKAINLSVNKKVEIESKYPLVKLGEYCENITKGTTPTTLGFDFINRGINFIKIESILQDGNYDKSKFAFINEECNQKMLRSQLKKNDILFSIAGALGRTAIVSDDILPANTNQAISIIRLKLNTNFKLNYLYQVLRGNIIQSQIDGLKVGIAQPNLSLTQIGNFKIPLPPLDIQEQIVNECQKVDDEVSKANEIIGKTKKEIENEINSVDGETTKLGEIFILQNGKAMPKNKMINGNIPVYGGNGIMGYHNESLIDYSTISIGRVGEYCGAVHITESKSWISDNSMYVTKFIKDIDIKFIYISLVKLNLNQFANKTSQPNISQPIILSKSIPIPSLETQKEIVSRIEKLEKNISDAKKIIDTAKDKKEEILKKYL